MSGEDREVEKLTKELQKQEHVRKQLLQSHTEVKDQLQMVKRSLKENEDDYDSIWKEKYQHQVDINEKLEVELAAFSRQLQEIKNASRKTGAKEKNMTTENGMSLLELQKLLEHLKKKKTELEWAIRDKEWHLDREGKIRDETEEDLKELQTQLNETSNKIIETHHHKKSHPLPAAGVVTEKLGVASNATSNGENKHERTE